MSFLLFTCFLIIIIILAIFCFSLLGSLWAEAPFVPTGQQELKWILKDVAKVRAGEVLYDLGSGDGRVVRAAARLGARAVGFEQSWLLTLWARFFNVILRSRKTTKESHASKSGIPRYARDDIRIIHGDYFKENLSDANVIFCYLMPEAMAHLKPKFERELKSGARIVSRAFKIPGWTPQERWQFKKRTPPVYVYIVTP